MKKRLEFKNIKLKKIIIIALSIVLLLGLAFGIYKLFFERYTTYVTVSYEDVIKKIDNKEKFVLFVGSEKCSHCTTYKGTLNRVISKYNIEIDYIDISKLTDTEYAYLNAHFPFSGTPTTMIIDNGVEYNRQSCRIEGAKSYEYTVERLKRAGIIKE